ncbi:saccharopine dehydrogenase NADP-binding domain-containing protein [Microlunatus flavus]|uniref:Uncharacterized conserved protein n=1 Tax=Microlunatus flavus TaxID=1036181 RepID=A0A1H9CIQ4_9ACTN|nr:saccharopine dehydrogenase NADP-binding domain-containing protein [Microlunatus flavus]SEQ01075.1 Uncharacterized conserved protein [Microlunatus flavus]
MDEVWILGGTGRTGRAVASALAGSGAEPVLVGRDPDRLRAAAAEGGHRTLALPDVRAMAGAVAREHPAIVLSTVGPFTTSAPRLVDACLAAGSDYVDVANDLAAVPAVLARHAEAERAGRTLVTGAGFGVAATESVVVRLCDGSRRAVHVRTDMLPSMASDGGLVGEALAGTVLEGLPGVPGGGRFTGRRYRHGRLSAAPIGGEVRELVTPGGDRVRAGLMPLGELVAAQRASGAPSVDCASGAAPSAAARTALRLGSGLLHVGPLRRFATRRLAAVRLPARPAPRSHSWGHATVTWEDGTRSEGWLRLPDAQVATVAFAAEVCRRLARGEGRPGAFTPAALFGPDLATSVGGEFVDPDGADDPGQSSEVRPRPTER